MFRYFRESVASVAVVMDDSDSLVRHPSLSTMTAQKRAKLRAKYPKRLAKKRDRDPTGLLQVPPILPQRRWVSFRDPSSQSPRVLLSTLSSPGNNPSTAWTTTISTRNTSLSLHMTLNWTAKQQLEMVQRDTKTCPMTYGALISPLKRDTMFWFPYIE